MKKTYKAPLSEAIEYKAERMLAESAGTKSLPEEGSDIVYESRRRQRNAWSSENWTDDYADDEEDFDA